MSERIRMLDDASFALEAHRAACVAGCSPSQLCAAGRQLLDTATRVTTRRLLRGRRLVALAIVFLVACRAPAPRVELASGPIHAIERRPRPCMRPPPAEPELTGDESIDRHRRDWHRDRLMAWAALAYETCR